MAGLNDYWMPRFMDFIYKQGEGRSSITLNQHGTNIDTFKNAI